MAITLTHSPPGAIHTIGTIVIHIDHTTIGDTAGVMVGAIPVGIPGILHGVVVITEAVTGPVITMDITMAGTMVIGMAVGAITREADHHPTQADAIAITVPGMERPPLH